MSRLVPALVASALLLSACTGGDAPAEAAATPAPVPSPSPSPSIVINPPGVVVENDALGPSVRRVRRAMRDLKAVNLWRRLTVHLWKVKFQSRLGAVNVPDDGHLADAILTAGFGRRAQGRVCDVMFFPNAIARDLDRWRLYYARGATTEPPPTLRQLWGAVTAHELGHCFPGGPGEKVAGKWERKALARLRELSL
jgi:hypothetical protein